MSSSENTLSSSPFGKCMLVSISEKDLTLFGEVSKANESPNLPLGLLATD